MSVTNAASVSDVAIQMMFKSGLASSSSDDLPMDQWSSLFSIPESETQKMILYKQGLYDPGSGEVCTKYIRMSDSRMYMHPYYNHPKVKDPGILEALEGQEDAKVHSIDGQDLYLDLCEEMNVIPVRTFHRGLLHDVIDLKYYGVNPVGVRAMSMALLFNRHVTRLDLTSNILDLDACYHLGQMLGENVTLRELVLSGCSKIRRMISPQYLDKPTGISVTRKVVTFVHEHATFTFMRCLSGGVLWVGPEGLRRLVIYLSNRPFELLDVSRNELGDEGFEHLTHQITKGAVIKRLNLSYNNLGPPSVKALAGAIEFNNHMTCLDLSWNKLRALGELITQLGHSNTLEELNLSWNALKGSKMFRKLLVPTLRTLDLSNNRLNKFAISAIANNLGNAKNLRVLDVSSNPLTVNDAMTLVSELRSEDVKLSHLLMDNVVVNREFVRECKEVLELSFRKNCRVTYGHVIHDYTLSDADLREIIFKRIEVLVKKAKKCELDVGIYFLQKKKAVDILPAREMMRDMKVAGAPIGESLVMGLIEVFPGPKLDKIGKTLDLKGVVDYVSRIWPEKRLPPTPPIVEPGVEKKKKKSKGKSKR